MKSLLVLLLAACVFAVNQDIITFCHKWHESKYDECVQEMASDLVFQENLGVVKDKQPSDPAVDVCYYLPFTRNQFEDDMIMKTNPLPITAGSSSFPPECSATSFNRNYPKLNALKLDDSITSFFSYPITGALDLLYATIRQVYPQFDVTFSVDMVMNMAGANATIYSVLDFLQMTGVCSEESYKAEVAAGRKMNPTCCVYKISNYKHIRGLTTCALAERVVDSPVYVELALNPYYLQLFCAVCPTAIHKAYYRYTVAGLLTGYSISTDSKYWYVNIRRHGDGENTIRVKLSWESAFAAITSRVFELTPDISSILNLRNSAGGSCAPQIVTVRPSEEEPDTPHAPTPAPGTGDPCGARFWSNEASGYTIVRKTVSFNGATPDVKVRRTITHLYVADSDWNDNSSNMNFDKYENVRYICIGHHSGHNSSPFKLSKKLTKLIGIYVGDYSLTSHDDNMDSTKCGKNKIFELMNMPNLEEVIIGRHSFGDYTVFTLNNLPKLKKLQIGTASTSSNVHSDNFYCVNSFNVNVALDELVIGNYGFKSISQSRVSDFGTINNDKKSIGYGAFDN